MGKLGYSSVTLTDLTETIPVTLVLETNQSKNIQTKVGSLYNPDFYSGDKELIITPSLFLGNQDLYIEKQQDKFVIPHGRENGFIYYELSGFEAERKKYYYGSSFQTSGIWVDNEGKLHIKKNLTDNLTIEAYIQEFQNEEHSSEIKLVQAVNPITFLFLETGGSEYTAYIVSKDGREHFEESNQTNIILTAYLDKGGTPLTDGVSYEWDIPTDIDDSSENDFSRTSQSITVQRKDVSGTQVFACKMTLTDGSKLSFSASKILRDFVDIYTCQIIADSSLILTPNNTSVTLINQIWSAQSIINEGNSNHSFTYEWYVLKKDGTSVKLENSSKEITIVAGKNNIPQDEVFSIFAKAIVDKKYTVTNYIDIRYQPTIYTKELSQKTFFIPVTNSGKYIQDFFEKDFTFKLVDEAKQPLLLQEGDGLLDSGTDDQITWENNSTSWSFNCKLSIQPDNGTLWGDNIDFKFYTLKYRYLGQELDEEIEVIKVYAGEDGVSGTPSYTIDLSNEFHAFSGGEGHADSNQNTSCIISAFSGSEPEKIAKIYLDSTTNPETLIYDSEKEELVSSIQYPGVNLWVEPIKREDKIELRIRTNNSENESERNLFLTESKPIKLYIAIEKAPSLFFLKIFDYTINYSSKSYSLSFSPTVLKQHADNTFNEPSISISALSKNKNGEATSYTQGTILYLLNTGENSDWKKSINNTINDYSMLSNLQEIKIRLYGAQAIFSTQPSAAEVEDNKKYLLDEETIPVLKTLEGFVLGGENLIKWSKTLAIAQNKWNVSNLSNEESKVLSIEESGDFSAAVFSGSNSLCSPLISYVEEYKNRDFCLSFYIERGTMGEIQVLIKDQKSKQGQQNSFQILGKITPSSSESFVVDTEGNGYQRAYLVFQMAEVIDSNFYIQFLTSSQTEGFKIKQPKLQIGNIPSDWSSSPYDIVFSEIAGTNLISSGYYFKLDYDADYRNVYEGFKANTDYTLSWSSIEPSDAQIQYYLDNSSIALLESSPITFNSQNYKSLKLKNNSDFNCIIKQLKLEIGSQATPYFFDENQLNNYFNNSTQNLNTFVNNAAGILDSNGKLIVATQNDINLMKSEIQLDINNVSNEIIATRTTIDSTLATREEKISINKTYGEANQQAIILSSKTNNQNGTEMVLVSDKLIFRHNNEEVAWLSNQVLHITHAEIQQSLRIGNIKFIPTVTGTAIVIND